MSGTSQLHFSFVEQGPGLLSEICEGRGSRHYATHTHGRGRYFY
jgi:hypothetical protein